MLIAVRHNCEVTILAHLRQALEEAYRQQNLHHQDRDEFTYWQGKVHGLEEAIRIVQQYSRCGESDGIGPRSFGF